MRTSEPTNNPEPINIFPQQPSGESSPPAEEQIQEKKPSRWLIIGLEVLTLTALGAAGLFAYRYFHLKQQLSESLPAPSDRLITVPSPVLSPEPTVDPTANWKEFEYPQLKFKIKLPPDWSERGGSVEEPYFYDADKKEKIFVAIGEKSFWEKLDEKTTIDLYTFDLSDPNHRNYFEENLNTADSIETVKLNGKTFKKYYNVALEIAPGSTKNFTFWTLEEASLGAKFMIGDRFAGSNLGEDLVNQILSTFQFTN